MARLPRLSVAGHVHHIVQRGNNRQAIFASAADREVLLQWLAAYAVEQRVAVHAYVLLDNQFELLATPADTDGVSRLMQALGRRYVRYFNQAQGRTGTLWEGRYRSTVLQAERYLLPCMVYLDWSPVRAGLAAQPADFAWSSYGHYAGRRNDRWLVPHAAYWALGNTPFAREAAYAELVQAGLPSVQQQALADAVLQGWALGDATFVAELQKQTDRRVGRAKPGRPSKSPG